MKSKQKELNKFATQCLSDNRRLVTRPANADELLLKLILANADPNLEEQLGAASSSTPSDIRPVVQKH